MIDQCAKCDDFTDSAIFPIDIAGWHFCFCGTVSVDGEEIWTWMSVENEMRMVTSDLHPAGRT